MELLCSSPPSPEGRLGMESQGNAAGGHLPQLLISPIFLTPECVSVEFSPEKTQGFVSALISFKECGGV